MGDRSPKDKNKKKKQHDKALVDLEKARAEKQAKNRREHEQEGSQPEHKKAS